jgi:hypothetical protein
MLGVQKYKNIDEIYLHAPKTWNHIESLSINERLTIGVIARYQAVTEKERLDKYLPTKYGLEPKKVEPVNEVQIPETLRGKEETKDDG